MFKLLSPLLLLPQLNVGQSVTFTKADVHLKILATLHPLPPDGVEEERLAFGMKQDDRGWLERMGIGGR